MTRSESLRDEARRLGKEPWKRFSIAIEGDDRLLPAELIELRGQDGGGVHVERARAFVPLWCDDCDVASTDDIAQFLLSVDERALRVRRFDVPGGRLFTYECGAGGNWFGFLVDDEADSIVGIVHDGAPSFSPDRVAWIAALRSMVRPE